VLQNGKKAFELICNHPKSRFAARAGTDGSSTTEGYRSFAAVLPTGQPVEISSKKNQAPLTNLAPHTDKKPTREKLISLFWSDRGEVQARSSLRHALAALKRDLGGIEPPPTVDGTVALDGSAASTDVASFEDLAAPRR
jgi:hypothetical protein